MLLDDHPIKDQRWESVSADHPFLQIEDVPDRPTRPRRFLPNMTLTSNVTLPLYYRSAEGPPGFRFLLTSVCLAPKPAEETGSTVTQHTFNLIAHSHLHPHVSVQGMGGPVSLQ